MRTPPRSADTLRSLLSGIVDYAGLFPPARLDMAQTVANYARYLAGDDAWMLGRLVVGAQRLDEFERHAGPLLPTGEDGEPWQITALVEPARDPGLASDLDRIAAFNAAHAEAQGGYAHIGVIELRAGDTAGIDAALDLISDDLFPFFELPISDDPRGPIAALTGSDAGAKVRTGGVGAAAYPSPEDLAQFVAACAKAEVPFKATAGLHHPLRRRNETLGADEFGFLNVFVAGALAFRKKMDEAGLREVLTEGSLDSFSFDEHTMRWRDHELTIEQIDETRLRFAVSFGSCSFEEPLDDLRAANLI